MKPNLFVVGAVKSGTTSLYKYLKNHPDVIVSSEKEPAFFMRDGSFDEFDMPLPSAWSKYLELFSLKPDKYKWVADASPIMAFPKSAIRTHKACGNADVRIVACLRDPVERAYSHYWHAYRLGTEKLSPNEAFVDESPDFPKDVNYFPKHYLLTGRYHLHLDRYIKYFGADNVLLLKFEDFIKNPDQELNKLWGFLGLETLEQGLDFKENQSQMPRSVLLQRFVNNSSLFKKILKKIIPSNVRLSLKVWTMNKNLKASKYPPISDELREKLGAYYCSDNIKLNQELGFDIKGWTSKDGKVFE